MLYIYYSKFRCPFHRRLILGPIRRWIFFVLSLLHYISLFFLTQWIGRQINCHLESTGRGRDKEETNPSTNIRNTLICCRFHPTGNFSRQRITELNWSSGRQRWERNWKDDYEIKFWTGIQLTSRDPFRSPACSRLPANGNGEKREGPDELRNEILTLILISSLFCKSSLSLWWELILNEVLFLVLYSDLAARFQL